MKTAAEDEADGAGIMSDDKRLRFEIRLSNTEIEANTWSLADTERITS